MSLAIASATDSYERRIRRVLSSLPLWLVVGARISRISIISTEEIREMRAAYRHGTRDILLYPNVGDNLRSVLAHEFVHGIDDGAPEGSTHRFSRSQEWMNVWRHAGNFRQKKFRDQPQEYFADACSLAVLQGVDVYALAHPYEAAYIREEVIPLVTSAPTSRKGS